jgi:hypothetical protein
MEAEHRFGSANYTRTIEVVSKRLGHSTIGIRVDRYVTVYCERDVAAAQAFEQLVR